MAKDDYRNNPLLKLLERLYEDNRTARVPVYPPDPQSGKIKLPPNVEAKLSKLVSEGKKVEAIKEVLDLTGVGLRTAKDYVDELEQKSLLWSSKSNPKK